jgi:hypothetical protein
MPQSTPQTKPHLRRHNEMFRDDRQRRERGTGFVRNSKKSSKNRQSAWKTQHSLQQAAKSRVITALRLCNTPFTFA